LIEGNEAIGVVLSFGAFVFLLWHRERLRDFPGRRFFFEAFAVLLVGLIVTLLEGFFLPEVLNTVEHAAYAVSAVLVARWCWEILPHREGPA